MHIDENVTKAKDSAVDDLLKRPGVTGVDVGFRYVNGQRTDQLVIRVFVKEKKNVSAAERIPQTILGIPTDIIQNEPTMLSDAFDPPPNAWDPLPGGAAIITEFGFQGTGGMVVFDAFTGRPMMLTNYHVLEDRNGNLIPGTPVYQPSRGNAIGAVERGWLGGTAGVEVDAALVSINLRDVSGNIMDIGPVTGVSQPSLGMTVRKYGAGTGFTEGVVTGTNATIILADRSGRLTTFSRQISVQSDLSKGNFAAAGDSGSVIVNVNGQVIGLLFSGDAVSFATPIMSVLNILDVNVFNPDTELVPCFRLHNEASNSYIYTTDWREQLKGYWFKRMQCAVYRSAKAGTVPLHRYDNADNDHYYTTNFNEFRNGDGNWVYKGVAAHVYSDAQTGTVPLHRYISTDRRRHFYSTDFGELGGGNRDWQYERIECFVNPRPLPHVSKPSSGVGHF